MTDFNKLVDSLISDTDEGYSLALTQAQARVLAYGLQLGVPMLDEAAANDIASHCRAVDGYWYDIRSREPVNGIYVDGAVCWLDMRGLLERHPENSNLVKVREAPGE